MGERTLPTRHLARLLRLLVLGLALVPTLAGCFKMAVPEVKPTQVILWPEPPAVPRISFVNTLARPEDLGISEEIGRAHV